MSSSAAPEPEQVQQIFDRIAPVYDALNDWLSFGQHRIWKKMAVRWSNPQSGQKFLDLCCGSGDLAIMLARRIGATGEVVGVDFSCQQLATAAQRVEALPQLANRITWQEGNALKLEFPDRSFDGATMAYGLRNVINIPLCLTELKRVLKSGSIAAILDINRPQDSIASSFQQWYLGKVVVPIAKMQGLSEEYAYIAPSLERFPTAPEQEKLAIEAGFQQAKHYSIANGLMGILVLKS